MFSDIDHNYIHLKRNESDFLLKKNTKYFILQIQTRNLTLQKKKSIMRIRI